MKVGTLSAMLAVSLVAPVAANAQTTLDFEGLSSNVCCDVMPAGYGGFTWSNFGLVDGIGYGPSVAHAVTSGRYVAFNHAGFSAPAEVSGGSTFTFNSAYIATYSVPGTVSVKGFLGATELFSTLVAGSSTTTSNVVFNWGGIDRVSFSLLDGPNLLIDDMVFDGVTVDPVITPEPVTMVLLGSGLAGIGAARRRRKAASQQA